LKEQNFRATVFSEMRSILSQTLLKKQKKNLSIGQVIYFLNSLLVMHTMLKVLGVVCGHVEIPAPYTCISHKQRYTVCWNISETCEKVISLPGTYTIKCLVFTHTQRNLLKKF